MSYQLQTGWRWVSLAELGVGGLFVDGDWVESRDQDPAGSVRLTQLADVGLAHFRDRSDRWLREDQARRLSCTRIQPMDLLIARMPDPIGRACLVPEGIGAAVTVVDVAILRITRADVDVRFVMWAINSPQFHQSVVAQESGTTRKRISRRHLSHLRIPLPPLDEQRRIVELLDEHLSRLDAAEVQIRLCLARVRTARLAWLMQRLQSDVSRPLGDLLLDAATGWDRARALRVPAGDGFPYLRMNNVSADGQLVLADLVHVAGHAADAKRFSLHAGDVLVNNRNSAELVGKTTLVPASAKGWTYNNNLVRLRFDTSTIDPAYVVIQMNGPRFRAQVATVVSATTNVAALYTRDLRRLLITVPSLEVQRGLVAEYDQLTAQLGQLREALQGAVARKDSLRRALLLAAFAGGFVAPKIAPEETNV